LAQGARASVPLRNGSAEGAKLTAARRRIREPEAELIADTEVPGQVGNPPPNGEEIEHRSTKLGRITTSSHCCLLWRTAA